MSGYTPGPWTLHDDGSPFVYKLGTHGSNVFTASVQGGGNTYDAASDDEKLANARLIAAAPTMYEEAVKVVAWLDRLVEHAESRAKDNRFPSLAEANAKDADNFRASARGLRAAIAKAEGGES